MKKRILAAVSAGMLLVALAVPLIGGGIASANPPDGTPGEPNCHGVTVAGQAQAHGGLANAAADHPGVSGGTVQGLQDAISDHCD